MMELASILSTMGEQSHFYRDLMEFDNMEFTEAASSDPKANAKPKADAKTSGSCFALR